MKIYTKKTLIKALKDIQKSGWIKNARPGNQGGVGNTLEDLLGIEENNLPLPNAGEWEIKSTRKNSSSLISDIHIEPSPRAMKFVPKIFLPLYGWKHQKAGTKYPTNEMSFRQTIPGKKGTDRGFRVLVDWKSRKVEISFDSKSVDKRHSEWLKSVKSRIGLGDLDPRPYWGFDDLFHTFGAKLTNCFFIIADRKKENGIEYFNYEKILMLEKLDLNKVIKAIDDGKILIDFDARTGHNHGTKFRVKRIELPNLYSTVTEI